ncbi:MAG TPA: glutathione S-transferase C-terminal domain-containing protein, partial [Rhodanobacteraceae bacterium]|nr:glutathione S-transferase C-terminal domain-containing protein [Rhodanobacteraceae bacterium]
MIDLHYWPTPNGHKVTLFLEEAGLPYTIKPVDIGKGEQFKPDYLAISPNNKMPAIVDHAPAGGGAPVSVFESGAILVYLAVKTGRFIPADMRGRVTCLEWLFWQMGGLGPMTGQYGHFHVYAPEKIPYAMERYRNEAERLLDVLNRRLAGRAFITGDDYTIADMACYPWINPYDKAPLDLEPFAEVR